MIHIYFDFFLNIINLEILSYFQPPLSYLANVLEWMPCHAMPPPPSKQIKNHALAGLLEEERRNAAAIHVFVYR